MERRRHRRVHAQLKSWLLANSHEIEGETIDLSAGGAEFASSLPVELGKQVTVKPFGSLREATRSKELAVRLPEGARLGELTALLSREHAAFAAMAARLK